MPSLDLLQRHLWLITRKQQAEKSLVLARQLLLSQDPADIQTALRLLDSILKSVPQWDKAIELKARALLALRRFRDIVSLLQESVPSLRSHLPVIKFSAEDKINLLPSQHNSPRSTRKVSFSHCFASLQRRARSRCISKVEREQWKYIVLGQACCHLGMMDDAVILLSNGKKFASAARRKQSSRFSDDSFHLDGNYTAADINTANHLLGSLKLLLRRRTAALAAVDAGLYTEAARHLSKILDGRRGTPQAFVSECYMHRALIHQAANRIVDALADCNRCLALNPMCVEALSSRATIYETIGCFSSSVEDLESLKTVYETLFTSSMQWDHTNTLTNLDLPGCIDFINSRVASLSERGKGQSVVDHHRLLGLSRGCTRAEVERAYLLLSLKHRPDKSAHFVDRCEFVDVRDVEVVKAEARTLGLKLFKLLQKAYTRVMSLILEEEMTMLTHMRACYEANGEYPGDNSLSWCWEGNCSQDQHEMQDQCSFGSVGEVQSFVVEDITSQNDWPNCEDPCDGASCMMSFERCCWSSDKEDSSFSCTEAFVDPLGHLVDTALLAQSATCRELANVSAISSQGLSAEAWMGSNEWSHPVHTLSVT